MKSRFSIFLLILIAGASLTLTGCASSMQRQGGGPGPRGPMSSSGSTQWTSSSTAKGSCPWGNECPNAFKSFEEQEYVSQNSEIILEELAQGTGRHLSALAQLKGCSSDDLASLILLLKNEFSALQDSQGDDREMPPEWLLESIDSALNRNPERPSQCRPQPPVPVDLINSQKS
ncbi:MAG: DUF3015 family protein [SAR324 cluster bacterium]|nr:DUF3015 family protein [SAR324 cluster bacterium]